MTSPRVTLLMLAVASALLPACAGPSHHAASGELRFDTETAGKLRHAAAAGRAARVSSATRASASVLTTAVPLLAMLLDDADAVGELEVRLVRCARDAERRVNAEFFGARSPTRQECGEEVDVDGCGERVTRAVQLGQRKHVMALHCARQVLEQSWPASFSIEQRYRFYPNARLLETISREEETRLLAQGCTRELWRTIKPDIVLHSDTNLLRSVLILDFKFPCPDTNEPRWTRYGEKSAYAGSSQGQIYKEALNGEALIVSPRRGMTQ
ncbi:hypothetical protein ACN47A_09835 [Myxococcus fulvus]|uniref:hypothetical protein n=1 Tax=Myxococcus fulvus TaxID=33 RepID=UPI003B9A15E5